MAKLSVEEVTEGMTLARALSRGVRFLHSTPSITMEAKLRQDLLSELEPWHREEVARYREIVPYDLRPLFGYEWHHIEGALGWSAKRADTRKVLAKAFLGRYVLAWAKVERCSVLAASQYFALTGFRSMLVAEGHIGPVAALLRFAEVAVERKWVNDKTAPLRQERTGKPLGASIIRNWCFEADVPDPEVAVRGDWSTPEEVVAVARFLVTYTRSESFRGVVSRMTSPAVSHMTRWPKSRIRARANWKTPMHISAADRSLAREVVDEVILDRLAQAGLTPQARWQARSRWLQ